ncbi:MAG TPA: pyridoxine 5'-phosphate synthase [Ignavibacteria bacterium]|nr:pyridoxine 5'-phosphate synthase [Ignavibacteria bacterium]
MKLLINIDHIATLREARGEFEPDPVIAAGICEIAGADGIVCHLREDRRHINDRDVRLLREVIKSKLNLEIAATAEMIGFACDVLPDMVTLVPEKRQERTTEGGLNIITHKLLLNDVIQQLHSKDILVSLFINPEPENVDNAVELNADIIEIHTGNYANAINEKDSINELAKIGTVARLGAELGLTVTAGHGLNYNNILPIKNITEIQEVSIGHSIISRSVFTGLQKAVEDMVNLVR